MIKTSSTGLSRKSSAIFGNLQKFSENVWQRSCDLAQVLENLWKSSESGRKSLENREKLRHQYFYIINREYFMESARVRFLFTSREVS